MQCARPHSEIPHSFTPSSAQRPHLALHTRQTCMRRSPAKPQPAPSCMSQATRKVRMASEALALLPPTPSNCDIHYHSCYHSYASAPAASFSSFSARAPVEGRDFPRVKVTRGPRDAGQPEVLGFLPSDTECQRHNHNFSGPNLQKSHKILPVSQPPRKTGVRRGKLRKKGWGK